MFQDKRIYVPSVDEKSCTVQPFVFTFFGKGLIRNYCKERKSRFIIGSIIFGGSLDIL